MSKKITVTLSDKAEQYFYERMYSDTKDDGATACSQSEAISHSLESLSDFEKETDNHLEGWVDDFKKLDDNIKKFVSNPTLKEFNALTPVPAPISDQPSKVVTTEEVWISVNDALPDDSMGRVLCWCEDVNDLGTSYFFWNCSYSELHGFSDNLQSYRVTHWKQVSPPKK